MKIQLTDDEFTCTIMKFFHCFQSLSLWLHQVNGESESDANSSHHVEMNFSINEGVWKGGGKNFAQTPYHKQTEFFRLIIGTQMN